MKAGGINSLLVSAFVVLLPLVLTLWFREKALAAPAEARSAVWFWSFRFLRYLRPEQKFANLEALKEQIAADVRLSSDDILDLLACPDCGGGLVPEPEGPAAQGLRCGCGARSATSSRASAYSRT